MFHFHMQNAGAMANQLPLSSEVKLEELQRALQGDTGAMLMKTLKEQAYQMVPTVTWCLLASYHRILCARLQRLLFHGPNAPQKKACATLLHECVSMENLRAPLVRML